MALERDTDSPQSAETVISETRSRRCEKAAREIGLRSNLVTLDSSITKSTVDSVCVTIVPSVVPRTW